MAIFEPVGVLDELRIEVKRNGRVVDWRQSIYPKGLKAAWIHAWQKLGFYKNYMDDLITSAGKAAVANRLVTDVATSPFVATAIGIGTGAATVADTALGTESMRVDGTLTRDTTNVTNDTFQSTSVFDIGSTLAITESGVFDDSADSSGTLLCRQVFAAINLVDGDQVTFIWRVVVS